MITLVQIVVEFKNSKVKKQRKRRRLESNTLFFLHFTALGMPTIFLPVPIRPDSQLYLDICGGSISAHAHLCFCLH